MRKLTLTLSAAALALAGGTMAIANTHAGKADTNADGAVTRAEMTAHTDAMFARLDANGDGRLDAADKAAKKAERFAAVDANKDGEITAAEMAAQREERREKRAERQAERRETRMEARFAQADTDKSGGLSTAELDAMHAGMDRPDGARAGMRGKRGAHHGGHRMGGGGHMAAMADADGDKVVTRAEFAAAAQAHFAQADTNRDGSISAEEHKAARAKMRAMPRGGETPGA